MANTPQGQRPSRYGRRIEDLSQDELAYYREFLPPGAAPAPEPAEPADAVPQSPDQPAPRRRNRWLWLPHSLAGAATLLAIGSFTLPPIIAPEADPDLLRNYAMLCLEVAFFLLVFAALLYGIFMLSRFTDHEDDDERLMRPTDYAEQLYEKDLERASNLSSHYDSDWISGKRKR